MKYNSYAREISIFGYIGEIHCNYTSLLFLYFNDHAETCRKIIEQYNKIHNCSFRSLTDLYYSLTNIRTYGTFPYVKSLDELIAFSNILDPNKITKNSLNIF